MRKTLIFLCCLFTMNSAMAVLELGNISNPLGWVQTTQQGTYTVSQDGVSLFYRGKDTGMKLSKVSRPGNQIKLFDYDIPKKPVTPKPTPVNPQPVNPQPVNPQPVNPTPVKPGVAVTALEVAGGLIMQDQGFEGLIAANGVSEQKKTWSDFGASTLSGGLAGAGSTAAAAAIINVIPVGGQIAYGVAIAAGAVVGAVGGAIVSGKRIFAETDCETDPVVGKYACCNISNLSKIDAVRVGIGGEMFSEFPYVRRCVQGKDEYVVEQSWLKGRFLDDHWSAEAVVKFCDGYEMPEDGDFKIQVYGASEEEGKVCWLWECADEGYSRQGSKCVKGAVVPSDDVEESEPSLQRCVTNRETAEGKACCYLSAKVAKFVNGSCFCVNGGNFVMNQDGKGGTCVKATENTDESVCKAAADTGAYWDGKKCLCNGLDLIFIGGKCQEIAEAKACKAASDVAIWDSVKRVCTCKKAGYEWLGATCHPNQEVLAAENEAKKKVQSLVEGLKTKFASFEKSVWKDKEGNFNKARLASDSIAGVVLGTAGGLITSHVVKKSQVKSGFEDVQCTVGGQKVADWGDEFSVGIQ